MRSGPRKKGEEYTLKFRALSIGLMLAVVFTLVSSASLASAQNPSGDVAQLARTSSVSNSFPNPFHAIPITGTVTNPAGQTGAFTGTLNVAMFFVQGTQLMVLGHLTGNAIDPATGQ